MATDRKSPNWNSTMGRMPPIAAPTAAPTTATSEQGVSRTRSVPNSAARSGSAGGQLDKTPGTSIEPAALYARSGAQSSSDLRPPDGGPGGSEETVSAAGHRVSQPRSRRGPIGRSRAPPGAPPRGGRRRDHLQGLASAVGLALLEISLDAGHLVRHVSEAHHWPPTGASKSVERGRLHLHRQDTARAAGLDGRSGLAKRSVGGPRGPALQRNPDAREAGRHQSDQPCVGVAVVPRRQVVIAGAFVPEGALDEDEVRRLTDRRDLSGGGQAEEETAARGEELLRHEDREGGPDGPAHDAVADSRAVKHVEVGVIARPPGPAPGAARS